MCCNGGIISWSSNYLVWNLVKLIQIDSLFVWPNLTSNILDLWLTETSSIRISSFSNSLGGLIICSSPFKGPCIGTNCPVPCLRAMTQVQSAPAVPKMLIVGLRMPQIRLTRLTYLTWYLEMNRPQNLKMNQEFLAVPTVDQRMIFPTRWLNGSSTGTSGCWFLIGTFAQTLSMFQNAGVASVKSWRPFALRSKINF